MNTKWTSAVLVSSFIMLSTPLQNSYGGIAGGLGDILTSKPVIKSITEVGTALLKNVFPESLAAARRQLGAQLKTSVQTALVRIIGRVDNITLKVTPDGAEGVYKLTADHLDGVNFTKRILKEADCGGATCAQSLGMTLEQAEGFVDRIAKDMNDFTADISKYNKDTLLADLEGLDAAAFTAKYGKSHREMGLAYHYTHLTDAEFVAKYGVKKAEVAAGAARLSDDFRSKLQKLFVCKA